MNFFPLPLHYDDAGFKNGRRRIVLTANFAALTSLGRIDVPAHFISDGASIPKALWGIVGSPFDEFLEEAIIHDWLYSPENFLFTRAESDFVLKELMWNTHVSKWKIHAFYAAVRSCGWTRFKAPSL